MRNKTIIYAGGFALPDKNAAANRVVSNGKIFDSLGYKTVFLGASYSDETFDGIRQLEGYENMFEHAHPQSSIEWIKHMFSVENIEKLIKKTGNVGTIVLYNVPFFTLLKAKRAFRKKNIKVCYDCTEWTKNTDGSFLKKVFKAFDEILIRNFTHKIADKLIVISSMMANKYKNSELIVIPPLVDINNEIWHQKQEKDPNFFEFCFAGVPDGNKESLDKIVDAFSSLESPKIRLRIIGITRDDFHNIYPDCDILDKLKDKIIFMGKLSHSETIKYVLSCDCYIFIRVSDRRNNAGFPTKFAESFTCNVPIITTNVSDIGSYLKRNEKGILLEEMATDKIKAAMLSQIENGSLSTDRKLNTAFHYEEYKNICNEWLEK